MCSLVKGTRALRFRSWKSLCSVSVTNVTAFPRSPAEYGADLPIVLQGNE